MILFGIIVLFLSNVLITVYLIFISSMVQRIFRLPINSTKSPNWIFLLVSIIIPAIIFPIVVSIANHKLNDIHHIMIAVSNPMTWNIANITNIINNIFTNFPMRFAVLCVYTSGCRLFASILLLMFAVIIWINRYPIHPTITTKINLRSMFCRLFVMYCMIPPRILSCIGFGSDKTIIEYSAG